MLEKNNHLNNLHYLHYSPEQHLQKHVFLKMAFLIEGFFEEHFLKFLESW